MQVTFKVNRFVLVLHGFRSLYLLIPGIGGAWIAKGETIFNRWSSLSASERAYSIHF